MRSMCNIIPMIFFQSLSLLTKPGTAYLVSNKLKALVFLLNLLPSMTRLLPGSYQDKQTSLFQIASKRIAIGTFMKIYL